MIAVAESGSTKCEWVILDKNQQFITNIKTQGFNPDFHNSTYVHQSLLGCKDFEPYKTDIEQLFFYGASCSSKALQQQIANGLQEFFTKATIVVDHDLLAAAYSLYQDEPLISCILGTGSNSAFFDGKTIVEKIPALGFILGDEAGGGYFGKKLLADYFYKQLPDSIQKDFSETFQLSWNDARKKIYGSIHANVYLASFMPFIAKHREEPYVDNLIREGLANFISTHVACFPESKAYEVGFVGSIAYFFKELVHEELNKQGFRAGKIIQSPIQELIDYHKKYQLFSPHKQTFENGIPR